MNNDIDRAFKEAVERLGLRVARFKEKVIERVIIEGACPSCKEPCGPSHIVFEEGVQPMNSSVSSFEAIGNVQYSIRTSCTKCAPQE